jgi:hypothetical protein
MNTAIPSWELVSSYPFRQPERVFFNPFNANEMWVSSFGNGMKEGFLYPAGTDETRSTHRVLRIYPDPSSEQITIERNPGSHPGTLRIINTKGQEMLQKNVESITTDVQIAHLPDGVYIVKITSDQEITTGRFIKKEK